MPVRSPSETLAHIFANSVKNEQTGCVVWQGLLTHKGYGVTKYKGKDCTTHRDRSGKKLNIAKVVEIKKLLAAGMPHAEIAAEFGIACSNVSRINTGHRWGHVASVGG